MNRSDYLSIIGLSGYFLMLLARRFHYRKGKQPDKRVEEDGRLIGAVVLSAIAPFFILLFLFSWKDSDGENTPILIGFIAALLISVFYYWYDGTCFIKRIAANQRGSPEALHSTAGEISLERREIFR